MTQRDKHLKLTFVFAVWEMLRIAVVDQRGVIHLPTLDGAAEVIHQMLAHQGLREVAPGVRAIVQTDTRQNIQPRVAFGRLLIAEVTVNPQRFGFHIQVLARQFPALVIVLPGQSPSRAADFQRCPEHIAIRQGAVFEIKLQTTIFHTATQCAGEVIHAGQQFPVLPADILPKGLETRFFRLFQRDIQRQRVDLALRLQIVPAIQHVRAEEREGRQ
ncbi:hypothetical protein D3C72_1165600 [compost metagenome]